MWLICLGSLLASILRASPRQGMLSAAIGKLVLRAVPLFKSGEALYDINIIIVT